MQKSTPISQLPNMSLPVQPQVFVNDQQRNIVTQAQQASQTFQMPQNTQSTQQDILNEDSTTIQDALDSLMPQQNSREQEIADYMARVQEQKEMELAAYSANGPVYDPNVNKEQHVTQDINMKEKIINDVLSWNDELKIALFATGLFFMIQSFPIENIVYKYVAFNKIPNSHLVIKGLAMFIGMLIITKLSKL